MKMICVIPNFLVNCFCTVFYLCSCLFISNISIGQIDLPASNIYMLDIAIQEDTIIVQKLSLLTDFNGTGYNNQPYWYSDSTFFFTSNYTDHLHTNLFDANVSNFQIHKITDLKNSSVFSPQLSDDGQVIYSIRAFDSGEQYLYGWHLNKVNDSAALLSEFSNIGYYLPIRNDEFVVFRVGDPHELWHYNMDRTIASGLSINIGRCILKSSENSLMFTQTLSNEKVVLKSIDLNTKQSKILAYMPENSEDFWIASNGSIYCTHNGQILKLHRTDRLLNRWLTVCDLSDYGLYNLSRLALSPNGRKLLVVNSQ